MVISQKKKTNKITECKCQENHWFIKQIEIGDEEWLLYNNVKCKRLWEKQNKNHSPYQRSVYIQKMLCWGLDPDMLINTSITVDVFILCTYMGVWPNG